MPDIVFDIGANVGFYTLICRKYRLSAKFHAFEPSFEAFAQLQENIVDNEFEEEVSIYNLAASSGEDVVEFVDFGECSGKNCISRTSIHGVSSAKKIVMVKANSLDNMFHVSNQRLALKVDTEGHEESVLQGGKDLLRKNACLVQIETGHGNNANEAHHLLCSLGFFQLYSLGPDGYYTNDKCMFEPILRLQLLERAVNVVVSHRWNIEREI